MSDKLIAGLRAHIAALGVGCCSCGIKLSAPQWHDARCKVHSVAEALDNVDALEAEIARVREALREAVDEITALLETYDDQEQSNHPHTYTFLQRVIVALRKDAMSNADLVKRLRSRGGLCTTAEGKDAADAIEALEAESVKWRHRCEDAEAERDRAKAEVERLKDQIYESIPKWQANDLQKKLTAAETEVARLTRERDARIEAASYIVDAQRRRHEQR